MIVKSTFLREKNQLRRIDSLKCYTLPAIGLTLIINECIIVERATTWSTLYIEIDFSNTRVRIYSRRRSSILLRFCRAEYCASPFCHPPAGFQCCNHGDVAFPQGKRVKGVGRIYASMERLPLLKLTHVSRAWCINKTVTLSLPFLCCFSRNNICTITNKCSLISLITT